MPEFEKSQGFRMKGFTYPGKSPVKKHDGTTSSTTHYADGSPKSKREVEFSKRHEEELRKEKLLNQGFTPEDADKMIKTGATTGEVDPDAPGTPGTPGYEPPVRRSDLDKKGKAIWDAHRAKKKSPAKQLERIDPKIEAIIKAFPLKNNKRKKLTPKQEQDILKKIGSIKGPGVSLSDKHKKTIEGFEKMIKENKKKSPAKQGFVYKPKKEIPKAKTPRKSTPSHGTGLDIKEKGIPTAKTSRKSTPSHGKGMKIKKDKPKWDTRK